MKISPIRHTWSGEFAIGYQTVGDGPVDMLYVAPWASNLDWNWRGTTTRGSSDDWGRSPV